MPFNSGVTIGSSMPRINASVVNCQFLDHEAEFYKTRVEAMISTLVIKNRKTQQLQ